MLYVPFSACDLCDSPRKTRPLTAWAETQENCISSHSCINHVRPEVKQSCYDFCPLYNSFGSKKPLGCGTIYITVSLFITCKAWLHLRTAALACFWNAEFGEGCYRAHKSFKGRLPSCQRLREPAPSIRRSPPRPTSTFVAGFAILSLKFPPKNLNFDFFSQKLI